MDRAAVANQRFAWLRLAPVGQPAVASLMTCLAKIAGCAADPPQLRALKVPASAEVVRFQRPTRSRKSNDLVARQSLA